MFIIEHGSFTSHSMHIILSVCCYLSVCCAYLLGCSIFMNSHGPVEVVSV